MTTLRQALYGIALLAALGLLLWGQQQRIAAADGRADLNAQLARTSLLAAEGAMAVVDKLQTQLETERAAQSSLRTTQNLLRQGLSDRETQIQELQRENTDLRQWADQPLPATARRLRQRPTITGAAAYRAWLSGSGALRPAGDQPSP